MSPSTLTDGIVAVRKKAAAQGFSPAHNLVHVIPEPYVARGHSTYYDRDGKVAAQWVKTRLDDRKYFELLQSLAKGMAQEVPPILPTPAPEGSIRNLANLYVMTDAHIGMLASKDESGAEWNLEIAERTLVECFRLMVLRSPKAHTCVIAQLGDWLHFDGFEAVTDRSKHVLDASGRFGDVMQAGVRVLRRLVKMALDHHEQVTLVIAEGNHDQRAANWMQVMFRALYELEPRVTILQTPKPYYAIQHGKTALFFTHGHLAKGQALGGLFAAEFAKMWGDTTKRYVHTGHLHSVEEKGLAGVRLIQHPTLAARDAYAVRGGWLSERQASATTYHSEFGEVGRVVVTPEMI
jgi:hypothetical protein